MDRMQATPRGAISGLLADAMFGGLNYMKDPRRTQQMQGLAAMLESTGVPAVVDRISYGEPLTTGRGMTTKLRPEAENTLMAALGMTPVGKPAQAGAMALGRAGERVAERVVPQVMERGGLPAEMLSAMAQGTQSPATVFHGTPHLFNKFDSSKIGTGEGAQVYGHGLYLAESPDVAKQYKETLAHKAYSKLEQVDRNNYRVTAPDGTVITEGVPLGPATRAKGAFDAQAGNLYQVDLPDEQIAKMLDWDKPLSQQSPEVQKALAGMGYKVDKKEVDAYSDSLLDALMSDAPAALGKQPLDMSGESIYRQLTKNASSINTLTKQRDSLVGKYQKGNMSMADAVRAMNAEDRAQFSRIADQIDNTKNSAAVVSEALRQAGIPGIRYLDQGSRGTSGGEILGVVKDGDSWRARVRVDNRAGVGFDTPTQIVTKSKPYKTKEEAQKWAEQATGQGTSNFVVFPGMEDMLRIEQINNQPVESLFQTLGR